MADIITYMLYENCETEVSEMLNIYFGNMPEAVFNTSVYFKNAYEDAWITDPFAREMIQDIDKSVVLDSAVKDIDFDEERTNKDFQCVDLRR